jgi:hypothetical protein
MYATGHWLFGNGQPFPIIYYISPLPFVSIKMVYNLRLKNINLKVKNNNLKLKNNNLKLILE